MSRRTVLLEALAATPRDLARLLRPMALEAATWRPVEGRAIAEAVAELGLREEQAQRILGCREPTASGDWNDSPGPRADSLEAFARRRAATLAFLEGLGQRDWGRPVGEPERDVLRLRDYVQELVTSDNELLTEILGLREAYEGRS